MKKKKLCPADLEYKALRKEALENKRQVNCFQDVVLDLMSERGLKDADVIRGTGMAVATWNDWIRGSVKKQMVDENLYKVMMFFNVSLHYLCFGIGDDEPMFKD